MRFKVKAADSEAYDRVLRLLEGGEVPVFVRSRKRRYVSTGELPGDLRLMIEDAGADIVPEAQYSAD